MLAFRTISFVLLAFALHGTPLRSSDSASSSVPQPGAFRRAVEHERTGGERQREGTRLTEITGRFELAGDRVIFHAASGRESYRLLENLALERVAQVLSESRSKQDWIISGTLTEFRGANYLLLTKAVIKTVNP
jgi:hypothetical protein